MRKIPAVVAVLGLTAVGLVGCAIPAGFQACPRPSAVDPAITDLVTVSGEVGAQPTVSVRSPFHTEQTAFEDLATGTGPALTSDGQLMVTDFTIVSGETGDPILATRYTGDVAAAATFGGLIRAVPALDEALECATEGTRTVVAIPPGGFEAEAAATVGLAEDESAVMVIDLQKVYLPRAQGALVYNDALGLPTVVRAPDGRPGVIIPDATAPDELVVQTLIKGDGAAITGDVPARIAYTGLTWDDRTVFDTTWDSQPAPITLDGVVPGFRQALEGATVGSQLLIVIPPELGYGDQAQEEIPANSTLVFVVDILGLDAPAEG